ncbi:hypothetical protein EF913_28350 [Streptomyces sp. WAC04189]|uniref:hypothetical protein n=1 Tax=Streptomyces sp. WAC04189 TaxID=2487411 RepID=UPI000FB3B3FE|nr:hypothetical protein [Streptomyces sp. WAC04189]RSR98044.1 hypothetical protein EF913_28350 [Streptomyces sp. WAC04189]
MTGRTPSPTGQALIDTTVTRLILEIAERLETNRPDEPITTIGRHAALQATTMDPPLLRALRARVPEITGSRVRREFAAELRQIAGEA